MPEDPPASAGLPNRDQAMLENPMLRRPKLLVTASEPFAGLLRSSAQEVARLLQAGALEPFDLTVAVLPVDFGALPDIVAKIVDEAQPDFAIGMGVELGSPVIRLETVSLNVADFPIADNVGNFVRATIPFPGSAVARAGSWFAADLARGLRKQGIPAITSHFAGTHLCNLTYYAMLQCLERVNPDAVSGYIHLPLLPENVAEMITHRESIPDTSPPPDAVLPSMSLELQLSAVRALLALMAPRPLPVRPLDGRASDAI